MKDAGKREKYSEKENYKESIKNIETFCRDFKVYLEGLIDLHHDEHSAVIDLHRTLLDVSDLLEKQINITFLDKEYTLSLKEKRAIEAYFSKIDGHQREMSTLSCRADREREELFFLATCIKQEIRRLVEEMDERNADEN